MLTKILDKKLGSSIFTGRQIISMLMPLIMDSFFVFGIGVLTTAMISSSSQESVAAISLVGPLYMMVYAINNAISAGGTVVVAMFKGKGETERVKEAAGQLIVGLPLCSLAACILLVLCADPLIRFLFHGMEETILVKAEHYLIGVAISAVFLSVYMSGFAVFRGLGETKKCLHLSILINVLHFVASFVFINILKLDIMGSALSLNLARLVGGMAAVLMLISKKSSIEIRPRHVFRIDWRIQKEIFRIGIPCGMEQLFMNGGAMLVQVYIAKLGTASVAANAVSNSIFSVLYAAPSAVATLAVTIVGQCIGAGEKKLARRYGRSMVWLCTVLVLLSLAIGMTCIPLLLKLYQAQAETVPMIYRVLIIAAVSMPFFWGASSVLPSVMRSAGDASYASYFSLVTMWVVRVGLGYLMAIPMGLGLEGVWIAMCTEWAVKTVAFGLRFRGEKWLAHSDRMDKM
ncbi:MAG: MATE family efflux transporter [Gallintestinimicrobium sp.]|uniref:MATE family efflux transporter n=1 Tax=Gallintestinimicrobium sp. TaxID=2981655 RepID=UPI00399B8A5C